MGDKKLKRYVIVLLFLAVITAICFPVGFVKGISWLQYTGSVSFILFCFTLIFGLGEGLLGKQEEDLEG